MSAIMQRQGYDELWLYFGMSRASWLTLPRSMMHEMPDDWQLKMAALLSEWDAVYSNAPCIDTAVSLKQNGRFIPMTSIGNYRHPNVSLINSYKRTHHADK